MDLIERENDMQPLIFTAFTLPALVATLPGAPGGFLAQRLGLDANQKEAVQRILAAHRPTLATRNDAFREARRALVDGCLDARLSEAQLAQLHSRSAAAAFELQKELHQVVRELDPVLTQEQKDRAKSMLGQARAHFDGLRALALSL